MHDFRFSADMIQFISLKTLKPKILKKNPKNCKNSEKLFHKLFIKTLKNASNQDSFKKSDSSSYELMLFL